MNDETLDGDSTTPDDGLAQEPMPETIGDYIVERELGSGGMGTVYLGKHRETQNLAAVKMLPASLARQEGLVHRFNREIEAMKKFQSPHIVELYESGQDHSTFYYAMEYVNGETITDRITREKRIPWREVIEMGVQICHALKAAHNAGIIHRDLKPSNLLIDQDGQIKLTDFGIAQVFASNKLTVTGGVLGTAEYMSPEQAQGKRANKQSDIYSLGAVLYVMLTGRPPFTGKTTLDICQKHRFAQFDSPKRIVPEIPHWLDEIVCKCLEKKPEDRYPDAYVLSLRLKEVPAKVDLSQAEDFELDGSRRTDETVVAGSAAKEPHEVGATLFRDLFRTQLESEQEAEGISKFLDNGWVLFGLLVIVVAGGYGLYLLNRPDPERMFARAKELLERDPGPAWVVAKRDYLLPLLDMDEATWSEKVTPLMEQVDLYEFRDELLDSGRRGKSDVDGQPGKLLHQIQRLREAGEFQEAHQRLQAFVVLFADDKDYKMEYELAQQLLEESGKPVDGKEFAFLDSALKRAEQHLDQGKPDQAQAIWRSILELYDGQPGLEAYLNKARSGLNESSS